MKSTWQLREIALTLVILLVVQATSYGQNWARFRGADGLGISNLKGIPTTWSVGDYAWNIELPGVGHAAPIIWGKNLFITTAVGTPECV